MSERDQRQIVVSALKGLHAISVENKIHPGTPDVNYMEGWIELKWLRAWPKRGDTVVRLSHFNVSQRLWLKRRCNLGGSSWLLLQCRREWLLFTGRDAADYVGRVTRDGLYRCARVLWTQGLIKRELVDCLTMDWEIWSGSPLVRPSSLSVTDAARAS